MDRPFQQQDGENTCAPQQASLRGHRLSRAPEMSGEEPGRWWGAAARVWGEPTFWRLVAGAGPIRMGRPGTQGHCPPSQQGYRSQDGKLPTHQGTLKALRLSLFRFAAQIKHMSYIFLSGPHFQAFLFVFSFSLPAPKNIPLARPSGAETRRKLPEQSGLNSRSSHFCCRVSCGAEEEGPK